MPKVSIVLPTYNGEEYLEQSVDSVISQTFADWELIIVDDCSTDETPNIVKHYAQSDARIRIIHNAENQKLPKSLNIGFSVAKGQYLTWTSDDNLYMPNAIATMVEYLDRQESVCMVRGDMYFIDEKGVVIGQSETYSNEKMYAFNCLGACFMYRKEVRDRIGDYDINTFCVEDYDYWLRVIQNFGGIASINQVLYKYRRHGKSLSETKRKQVNDQLTKLRICHIDKIFEILSAEKKELCRIYYEMLDSQYMKDEIKERFKVELPELRGEVMIEDGRQYIIFGAGNYGEMAARMLGERALFFADSNPEKAGVFKDGLRILSFQNAVKLSEQYGFMIAVSRKSIYEMMRQLQEAGVHEYCVFQP